MKKWIIYVILLSFFGLTSLICFFTTDWIVDTFAVEFTIPEDEEDISANDDFDTDIQINDGSFYIADDDTNTNDNDASPTPAISDSYNLSTTPYKSTTSTPDVNVSLNNNTIETLVENYVTLLCDAINSGDFSKVSPTLLNGSALYKSQQSLVDNLYNKGTTEQLENMSIVNIDRINDYLLYVTTREVITIHYGSGSVETNTYNWKYTIKYSNGKYYLSDIEKP